MSVVSYPCSFNSRAEKCPVCFTHELKWLRHGVVNLPFILLTVNVMKSRMHGRNL